MELTFLSRVVLPAFVVLVWFASKQNMGRKNLRTCCGGVGVGWLDLYGQ